MPPPKPCATLATHLWSQGTSLHLSLPGRDGWYDILRYWQCQRCGLQTWATGAIRKPSWGLRPSGRRGKEVGSQSQFPVGVSPIPFARSAHPTCIGYKTLDTLSVGTA